MSKRTAALAEALDEQLGDSLKTVSDCEYEVFVSVDGSERHPMNDMDEVCAVAYDHGFVPVGLVDHGATRLKPRDNDELRA